MSNFGKYVYICRYIDYNSTLCLDIRCWSRYTSAGASKIIIIEEIGKKSVIQRCADITRLPVYREPVYRERTVYILCYIINIVPI